MRRYLYIYILLALAVALGLQSCNKDDDNSGTTSLDYSVYSTSSTLVSSFSLKANTKILNNLDSVKFTIDQDRGLIYNADSLPRGTRINALLVEVSCASTVSSREFVIKNGTLLGDTTITYSNSSTDSIDFTGDVTLRITSADKLYVRDYKVKINVHTQDVDTLTWDASRRRDLPNVTSVLKASKTVQQGDKFLCLVDDNGKYVLSQSEDPLAGTWPKTELSFPFVPNVNSFSATTDALYILDENGELYKSDDMGASWTDCGVAWHSLIGAYNDRVLGVKADGSAWQHDEYPQRADFVPETIDDAFPVEGMSPLVMASNEWTSDQQAMTMGGIMQDGSMSNVVWGYDGETWAPLSADATQVLPALRDAVLFPYYTMVKSTGVSWVKRVTWMVMGGRLANGQLNTTCYISRNQCINWSEGENSIQQPSYMPAFYGAQVYAYNRTQSSGTHLMSYNPGHVTPVTEWECPYLYLFGGYNSTGAALNSVWEGVLTGLTFKPVF
ncbi:MAG: hypothetical protein IKT03_01210 [Muribaculaceae bacterium]|nr:hypothetical protein [Muribaculaceae bacterium]